MPSVFLMPCDLGHGGGQLYDVAGERVAPVIASRFNSITETMDYAGE